jgi:hypothetical protein
VSIPSLGGLSSRPDGLALSADGKKLYVSLFADTMIRVLDIDETDGSVMTEAPPICLPGEGPDIRQILAPEDGRFLYVSSRNGSTLRVFDLRATDPQCPGTPRLKAVLQTGVNSSGLAATPMNAVNGHNEYVFLAVTGTDALLIVDATTDDPSVITYSSIGLGAYYVAVSPGLATGPPPAAPCPAAAAQRSTPLAGSPVTVSPAASATITFSSVTQPGNTSVASSNVSDVAIPPGFAVPSDGTAVYYDVRTSALYEGPIDVCFANPPGLPAPLDARLQVLEEDTATKVFEPTTSVATPGPPNTTCGETTTLSRFVLALPCTSGDMDADGNVGIPDIFALVNYLFVGGPAPVCPADVNGDGKVGIPDLFYLISYLFAGGPPPV